MDIESQRRLYAVVMHSFVVVGVTLASPTLLANTKDQLGAPIGVEQPLQAISKKMRVRGPVAIEIPIAYVFGMGKLGSPLYCSPSIRAANSSNLEVEELVVGIDYMKAGTLAGSTVTRFNSIKVAQSNTRYFYQLPVSDCNGLQGLTSVLRCVYVSGEDCTKDVQMIGYGLIPLRLQPK